MALDGLEHVPLLGNIPSRFHYWVQQKPQNVFIKLAPSSRMHKGYHLRMVFGWSFLHRTYFVFSCEGQFSQLYWVEISITFSGFRFFFLVAVRSSHFSIIMPRSRTETHRHYCRYRPLGTKITRKKWNTKCITKCGHWNSFFMRCLLFWHRIVKVP